MDECVNECERARAQDNTETFRLITSPRVNSSLQLVECVQMVRPQTQQKGVHTLIEQHSNALVRSVVEG